MMIYLRGYLGSWSPLNITVCAVIVKIFIYSLLVPSLAFCFLVIDVLLSAILFGLQIVSPKDMDRPIVESDCLFVCSWVWPC